ncbi:malonate decarboxylase holo-ACP synthase, partial [Pseudomonas aeruginosa]|uniref:malonate decarboxylase holo-ACP synthase n=1 Tax=Pseudomonas aeruginosa TaxID=287 RepID=UPI0020D0DC94
RRWPPAQDLPAHGAPPPASRPSVPRRPRPEHSPADAPLNALGLAWGVTGGAGFELASGVAVLHPDSDLDLLLRTPRPFPRDDALRLLQRFEQCPCRIDLQLQTPAGGVALREWAEGRSRVLAKGSEAPLLLEDPWRVAEVEA